MSRASTSCPSAHAPPVRPPLFQAMYDAHLDFVFRCLRRLDVASGDVGDACQEVIVVLHNRLSDFRPGASERARLFGIAARVASQHRRKQARTRVEGLHRGMRCAGREAEHCALTLRLARARFRRFVQERGVASE